MDLDLYINEPFCLKRGHGAFAKSVDPGHPAKSTQAGLARSFFAFSQFLEYQMIHYVAKNKSKMSKTKT